MNKFHLPTKLVFILFAGLLSSCVSTQPSEDLAEAAKQLKPSISLHADFTKLSMQQGKVFDFFDVSVRTERGSAKSIPATFGRKPLVNTVRMLGGFYSQDLEADTYKWDGSKFVYDFEQATKRIDKWLDGNWDIFQIVLDNPPWAFQRGYHFVDKPDGKHYLKKDRVGVYGNGLPPADADAWHRYVQAFIQHLVNTYGKDTVLKWRFRVGSEIDTRPQHWSATRQAFFDHYKNTVEAVHTVLPEAVVGTHFREASFKSKYVDYTGNTEDSYAVPFIEWAKRNKVAYDFLAISYYPHIDKAHELDMNAVYEHDIAPIQLHPDWNQQASLEIHEYKLIVKMKRAGFESVKTSHNSAFFAMFSKMLLQKNIKEVFQWGNQRGGNYSPEAMTQLALYPMVGNTLFRNTISGTANQAGNLIDGIFTQSEKNENIDVLLYNFNRDNLDYLASESTQIKIKVDTPPLSSYQYRIGRIDASTNIDQVFASEFPKAQLLESKGGWRKDKAHPTVSMMEALNEEGQAVYQKQRKRFGKENKLVWSDWKTTASLSANDTEQGQSVISIVTELPSFAVQKLEIRKQR